MLQTRSSLDAKCIMEMASIQPNNKLGLRSEATLEGEQT